MLLIAGLGTLQALPPHLELISEAIVLKSMVAEGNEDFFELSFAHLDADSLGFQLPGNLRPRFRPAEPAKDEAVASRHFA